MGNVKSILRSKNNTLITIYPHNTVFDALETMVEKNVGALIVTVDGKLAGIITERDYARKVILLGKSSKGTLISEIMSEHPVTVSPENTLEDCMQIMINQFTRHLPVVENNELVGIISMGDLVKYIIDEQKFIIENLEHYIKGR